MDKKFRFKYRENGVVIEVDAWDVAEMVKNAHDWECLDDVAALLLGDAAHVLKEEEKPRRGRPPKND